MIEIRKARFSDANAIAELHARSWRENYRGSFRDEFLDGDLPGERLQVWRERLEGPDPEQRVEVAFDASDLVGFVCAYAAHDPHWGSFIDNLHVASSRKRNGVGSALMARVAAWLACRCPELPVYLLVLEGNVSARRFYERIGGENAEVSRMETHGGAMVMSCRYIWARPESIAAG